MSLVSRRDFLGTSASCAAHLALMGAGLSSLPRALWATPRAGAHIVAAEPWGRLERIADGVWAMVSTPLSGDRTTLCNGGLIAGRRGVVMVEAFASDAGAQWMAAQSLALTGRAPTHVVLTHYHADHAGGVRAAADGAAGRIHVTPETRALVIARNTNPPADLLAGATLVQPQSDTVVDLGDRRVHLTRLSGHTASDVAVHLEEPRVVFCGDLMWNGMFPNYVDAVPSQLSRSVATLRALGGATYVPGHGTVASAAELDAYITLLDSVEQAARRALERGITATAAGAEYRIPPQLGEWVLFNPRYYERAIGAWMRELQPESLGA